MSGLPEALARLRRRADGHDTPFTVLDAYHVQAELTRLRALEATDDDHATVGGVVLRDQTAGDLGIAGGPPDAYRSGPGEQDDDMVELTQAEWRDVMTIVDDFPQRATELDRLRSEVARLHTWDGLMSLLDEHYPRDVVDGSSGDPGPRIVALLREVAALRAYGEDLAELLDEVRLTTSLTARLGEVAIRRVEAWRSVTGGAS